MTDNIADIPQNTRIKALVSVNTAFFGWLLGGLPSCLGFFFPPMLVCTVPLFIGLSGIGALTGYQARKEMAEGVSDFRLNRASTMGFYIGIAGIIFGIIGACVLVFLFVLLGVGISLPVLTGQG